MQDEAGQVLATHSISAGLDYPGVGPEHSALARQRTRRRIKPPTDAEALAAFHSCACSKGSSRRSSRRMHCTSRRASPRRAMPATSCWYVSAAGATRMSTPCASTTHGRERGLRIRDLTARSALATRRPRRRPDSVFHGRVSARESMAGLLPWRSDAGCIAAEIGIPFSDPLADGPTIQRTGQIAIGNGMTLGIAWSRSARSRKGHHHADCVDDICQPGAQFGVDWFARRRPTAGVDGVIFPDLPLDEAADMRASCMAANVAVIPTGRADHDCPNAWRASARPPLASCTAWASRASRVRGACRPTMRCDILDAVRLFTPVPRALGFGLSTHEHLMALHGPCRSRRRRLRAARPHRGLNPDDAVAWRSDFLRAMAGGAAMSDDQERVIPATQIDGEVVPGDKSMSHRALILRRPRQGTDLHRESSRLRRTSPDQTCCGPAASGCAIFRPAGARSTRPESASA